MRSETGHVGVNLAVWGVVVGAVVAVLLALPAPGWVWAGSLAWLLLWGTAILGLSDGASRAFLSGTLRKSTYTQIYTTLTRRNVMAVWRRVCDDADDRDSVSALFRAALTWRLYDIALWFAVVYPVALTIGQWTATGGAVRLDPVSFLPDATVWQEHVAGLALLFGLTAGSIWAATLVRRPPLAAFTSTMAAALAVALGTTMTPGGALAVACCAGLALAAAIYVMDRSQRPVQARTLLSLALAASVVLGALLLDWAALPGWLRALFLFLGVFPLLNALFDTVSYAVTLTFLRRGLRARLPLLWGLADLLVACVLFLALGATLVAAVHGLNGLAGVPLVDLGALFAGVYTAPGDYVWLYLMLFSTILPTMLHFLVSLLGLQGVWPRAWRRPVADWIGLADRSALRAVRAALALSLIWWLPLALLGAALWALWAVLGDAIRTALGLYFEGLMWIARVPVGAL